MWHNLTKLGLAENLTAQVNLCAMFVISYSNNIATFAVHKFLD